MLKSQSKKPWYIDFSFKYSNWAGVIYTSKKNEINLKDMKQVS